MRRMTWLAIGSLPALAGVGTSHATAAVAASNACTANSMCLDTGQNQTGTEYTQAVAANAKAGTCYTIKVPSGTKIISVDNETGRTIGVGDGGCANPQKDKVAAHTKENLPTPVGDPGSTGQAHPAEVGVTVDIEIFVD